MIILNIPECMEVLTGLHKLYEDQYELEESDRDEESREFFEARASILSYIISQDALTSTEVEAVDELENILKYLQDMFFKKYNQYKDLYSVVNDKVFA